MHCLLYIIVLISIEGIAYGKKINILIVHAIIDSRFHLARWFIHNCISLASEYFFRHVRG